jgi:hypothetical protein
LVPAVFMLLVGDWEVWVWGCSGIKPDGVCQVFCGLWLVRAGGAGCRVGG